MKRLVLSSTKLNECRCCIGRITKWIVLSKILLLVFPMSSLAQVDTAWVRRYNGPGNAGDYAHYITVDNSGCVYITGGSWGPGTGYDYATIKYYPNGDTAWVGRYNGPASGNDGGDVVAVDDQGNVYVTGYSEGSGPFHDCATIKYYPNGDTAWVRRYTGSADPFNYIARWLALDNSGNVYVACESESSGTATAYATIKYSANGDTAWVRRYHGPGNGPNVPCGLAVDNSGFVYVTGGSQGFGTSLDYTTIKYYPNGDTDWVARYDGQIGGWDWANAMAIDSLGNVYVTGQSQGLNGSDDYATVKYYSNGDMAWVRRYNGPGNDYDRAYAVAVDNAGNVYVTGGSQGYGTDLDYATVKYYSNGDPAWVKRYNGPANAWDDARWLAIDNLGNVYVTGHSEGTWQDYATIKYVQATAIEKNDVHSVKQTTISATILRGPLQLPQGKNCEVFDITGRVVEPNKIIPGIYFVEIDNEVVQKVIKVK